LADITNDAAQLNDEGFHEIQLSGKQLVFLFMIAIVVLVATFLCGVQVGRGVKSDRGVDAVATEALANTTAPPAASTPSQPAASSGPPAAEPPAPAQEPDDELSYAKRLQSDNQPAEKLKPPASGAQTPAARPPVETKPAQPTPAPRPSAPAASAAPAAGSSGQPGAWIVQLTALQDRGGAEGIAKQLAAKGYPAFVLSPATGAPVMYRVQVGGYADRHEADQIARRLEKDEHYKPYVRRR
jgi:cell division septation protein DedD